MIAAASILLVLAGGVRACPPSSRFEPVPALHPAEPPHRSSYDTATLHNRLYAWNSTASWHAFAERLYCLLQEHKLLDHQDGLDIYVEDELRGDDASSWYRVGQKLYARAAEWLPPFYAARRQEGMYVKDARSLAQYVAELQPVRRGLACCAISKDEARNLQEWIVWHLLLGVEHVYLVDNDSSDHTKEVLQPFIEIGLVTYDSIEGQHRQGDALRLCTEKARATGRYQWLMLTDVDEFVYREDGGSLRELLGHFTNTSGLVLTWDNVLMGDQFFSRPANQLVTELRGPPLRMRHVQKVVANLEWAVDCGSVHKCDLRPGAPPMVNQYHARAETFLFEEPPGPPLVRLLHYKKQSFEDVVRKRLKGLAVDKPTGWSAQSTASQILRDLVLEEELMRLPQVDSGGAVDVSWASACVRVLLLHSDGAVEGDRVIREGCSAFDERRRLYTQKGDMMVHIPRDASSEDCRRLFDAALSARDIGDGSGGPTGSFRDQLLSSVIRYSKMVDGVEICSGDLGRCATVLAETNTTVGAGADFQQSCTISNHSRVVMELIPPRLRDDLYRAEVFHSTAALIGNEHEVDANELL